MSDIFTTRSTKEQIVILSFFALLVVITVLSLSQWQGMIFSNMGAKSMEKIFESAMLYKYVSELTGTVITFVFRYRVYRRQGIWASIHYVKNGCDRVYRRQGIWFS